MATELNEQFDTTQLEAAAAEAARQQQHERRARRGVALATVAVVSAGAAMLGHGDNANASGVCGKDAAPITIIDEYGKPGIGCTLIPPNTIVTSPHTIYNPKPPVSSAPSKPTSPATLPNVVGNVNVDKDLLPSMALLDPKGAFIRRIYYPPSPAGDPTCQYDRNDDIAGPTQKAYDDYKKSLADLKQYGLVLTNEDWCVIKSEGIGNYVTQITAAEKAQAAAKAAAETTAAGTTVPKTDKAADSTNEPSTVKAVVQPVDSTVQKPEQQVDQYKKSSLGGWLLAGGITAGGIGGVVLVLRRRKDQQTPQNTATSH